MSPSETPARFNKEAIGMLCLRRKAIACRAANPVALGKLSACFPGHVQRSECERYANRASALVVLARRRYWGARGTAAQPETPRTGKHQSSGLLESDRF